MANSSSPYLYNKPEETEHHSGVLEYSNREATINALLQKRTTILKDYLAEVANNSSSGVNSSLSGTVVNTLSGIDENVESVLDEISEKMHDDYSKKGIHNQLLISRKNEQLGDVVKKTTIESQKLKEMQRELQALGGEDSDTSLAVKTYDFQYFVFLILTLLIVVTTIVSASKSSISSVEFVILAFFCAIVVYRFFGYLKENVPIWWNKIANSVKGTFS